MIRVFFATLLGLTITPSAHAQAPGQAVLKGTVLTLSDTTPDAIICTFSKGTDTTKIVFYLSQVEQNIVPLPRASYGTTYNRDGQSFPPGVPPWLMTVDVQAQSITTVNASSGWTTKDCANGTFFADLIANGQVVKTLGSPVTTSGSAGSVSPPSSTPISNAPSTADIGRFQIAIGPAQADANSPYAMLVDTSTGQTWGYFRNAVPYTWMPLLMAQTSPAKPHE